MSCFNEGQLISKGGLDLIRKHQDDAREFFNAQYPDLYRYALYLTRDPETAQDLCQETFIRWFSLANPDEIDQAAAWLKKVLSNLAFNHFRHQKVVSRWQINCDDERLEGRVTLDQDLIRLEVEEVLSSLPWKEQMLLKMRLADLSYKEIAAALHVSTGSVGTMLARAMNKFKEAYEGKEVDVKNDMSGRRQTPFIPGRRTDS